MFELEAAAVLFDSDGVLIDSHRVVEAAWRRLSSEFELDADRLIGEQAGRRPEDTLSGHLSGEVALRAVSRLEELEFELVDEVEALPGARRLTGQMRSFPFAIATSGSRRLANARWERAGIQLPPIAVTADDVTSGKPDPAPYLKAAELLGVDPGRCVVFEDSPSGGASALAFGGTVVAVGGQPWPFEPAIRIADLDQVSFRRPHHPDRSALLTIHTRG